MSAKEIKERLQKLGNKNQAENSARYFKTGPGEYGEGDISSLQYSITPSLQDYGIQTNFC
jgi:hypothetical protein